VWSGHETSWWHGLWAAGTYGNPEIKTPNIDKLAEEGLKFNNAFCNTPVCSASRTSYFTGRLPSQNGVHDWIDGGNGCVDEGIYYTQYGTSYTDILTIHNYTCAISGKYHLGDQQTVQHSFKHWFVHQKGGASYINPPMVKNLQCVNIDGYVTDIITDDAIQYIQDYMKSVNSEPFYLCALHCTPQSLCWWRWSGRLHASKRHRCFIWQCIFHLVSSRTQEPICTALCGPHKSMLGE